MRHVLIALALSGGLSGKELNTVDEAEMDNIPAEAFALISPTELAVCSNLFHQLSLHNDKDYYPFLQNCHLKLCLQSPNV